MMRVLAGGWAAFFLVAVAVGCGNDSDDTRPQPTGGNGGTGGTGGAGGANTAGGGFGGGTATPCDDGIACTAGDHIDSTGRCVSDCALPCYANEVFCDGDCGSTCIDLDTAPGYHPARGAYDDPEAPNPYGGETYVISVDGSDTNDGLSIETPWATFNHANQQVQAGDRVYVRGGVYSFPQYSRIGAAGSNPNNYSMGTETAPITWRSYPGEFAILDGTGGTVLTGLLTISYANWNIFQNFEIRYSIGPGLAAQGSSDHHFTNIWTHDNFRSGSGASGIERVRFTYMTSSDNFDEDLGGENADGFAVGSGQDNVFEYCLAVQNSDDGIDLWESVNNTIRFSVARDNGLGPEGNGNGFKLGGGTSGGGNLVENCIAYSNRSRGYASNTGTGNLPNTVYNNVAYDSVTGFDAHSLAHVLKNNLEYGATDHYITTEVDDQFNSWNLGTDLSDADFSSLDPTHLYTDFLRLAPDSDAVDAGVNVGLPYHGAAPDLGAFETP